MTLSRLVIIGVSAMCLVGAWSIFGFFSGSWTTLLPGNTEQTARPVWNRPRYSDRWQLSQLASVNPLGSLSLDALKKTIERPLFNQTRAPKPLEVVADEPQGEPEEPQASADDFTLLGVGV